MPQYWLLKTEPSTYSYDNLVRDKKTRWDGVTNPFALRNIRATKKGDSVFVYHTGDEKSIVGIGEIMSDPYPDEKHKGLFVFDIAPKKKLKRPVTLAEIKAKKFFSDFELVKYSRLSVMPVKEAYWKEILTMAGED
jgi:predicted RNA-binding protein with PUA-like domain